VLVHLRVTIPERLTDPCLSLLQGREYATNVTLLRGASLDPAGDVVEADVAREEFNEVLENLHRIGVGREGGISVQTPTATPFDEAARIERRAPGDPDDAVIWDSVLDKAEAGARPTVSYLLFLVMAVSLAAIAVILDSAILVVGAMVVGPEFGPLAGFCVAVVERRRDVATRSLTALAVGFPIGIAAAFLFTLLAKATGMLASDFSGSMHPLTQFISKPDDFSFIVACLAGAAGMLSLTSAKSGALIGVLISVTTIPAAANIGVAAAGADWSEWRGAMAQLAVNLIGIMIAGIATLSIQRRVYERRRRRHMDDDSRAIAGLPNSSAGSAVHR
jgi:uncharacterized hydrophobic protein (TIGR00271 family)